MKRTAVAALVMACLMVVPTGLAKAQGNGQQVFNNGVVGIIADINVPALDGGQLLEFDVKLGQKVTEGKLLGRLNSADLLAQRDVLEVERRLAEISVKNDINVRFSRSSSEVSQTVLEKSRAANRLYSNTVSGTEMAQLRLEAERGDLSIEQALLGIETAEAEVELRDARLAALEIQLNSRQIVSPADGMIVSVLVSRGEWVQRGQPVLRLIRTDRVEVVALADARLVDQRLVGESVRVETKAAGANEEAKVLAGEVTFVTPEINPASGQVQIRAEVENTNGALRPGQRVKMTVGGP